MSTITVRQATPDDLAELAPLFDAYRRFYGQPADVPGAREFLRARFECGESTAFIAFHDGTAVGFTQLYPSFSSVSLARIYVLNDLYVAESGRRMGVGGALLAAAIAFARAAGAVRLMLSTAITNAPARALYEAGGWVRDEEFLVYEYQLRQ